jgi:hypothetical protein
MIQHHDAEHGINWQTVWHYLQLHGTLKAIPFTMNEEFDFESAYNSAPEQVRQILDKHLTEDTNDYSSLQAAVEELAQIGWFMDYYLSADITELRPMNQQELEVANAMNNTKSFKID